MIAPKNSARFLAGPARGPIDPLDARKCEKSVIQVSGMGARWLVTWFGIQDRLIYCRFLAQIAVFSVAPGAEAFSVWLNLKDSSTAGYQYLTLLLSAGKGTR